MEEEIPPEVPAAAAQPGGNAQQWSAMPADDQALATTADRRVVAHGLQMKRRNPVAAWIGLPLITLGIYHFVWYFKIHREMGEFDPRRNVPDIGPVLVLIFLGWTVIAPLISYFNCGSRIANAQRAAGLRPTCNAVVGMLLMLVLGLGTLYFQMELNRVHDAYGTTTPPGTSIDLYA
jgi:hypothetical protein